MAWPTTPARGTAADAAVGRLVVEIQAGLDELVEGSRPHPRRASDFRRLPASTLARAVRGNVGRALAALAELRPPRGAELEGAAAVGRERAEQGLSIDGVVHAYRISISAVWTRFGELPRGALGRRRHRAPRATRRRSREPQGRPRMGGRPS